MSKWLIGLGSDCGSGDGADRDVDESNDELPDLLPVHGAGERWQQI